MRRGRSRLDHCSSQLRSVCAPRQSRVRRTGSNGHRAATRRPGRGVPALLQARSEKAEDPRTRRPRTTTRPSKRRQHPAAEPIDVDADDASDGDDLDRFGPRTEVDLRLGESYASGVVVPPRSTRLGLTPTSKVGSRTSSAR